MLMVAGGRGVGEGSPSKSNCDNYVSRNMDLSISRELVILK